MGILPPRTPGSDPLPPHTPGSDSRAAAAATAAATAAPTGSDTLPPRTPGSDSRAAPAGSDSLARWAAASSATAAATAAAVPHGPAPDWVELPLLWQESSCTAGGAMVVKREQPQASWGRLRPGDDWLPGRGGWGTGWWGVSSPLRVGQAVGGWGAIWWATGRVHCWLRSPRAGWHARETRRQSQL